MLRAHIVRQDVACLLRDLVNIGGLAAGCDKYVEDFLWIFGSRARKGVREEASWGV